MHLHEFTDPRPYTVAVDDACKLPDLLDRMWSTNGVAFELGIRRPWESFRKRSDSPTPHSKSPQRHHSVHSP